MAWYDDLNNGLPLGGQARPGSIEALQAAQAQQKPVQAPKKTKNFLTDNISTGGGIAGALAGGAGGAAIGSIVPGIGTVIGGLIGSVIGGAGGSAGGQVAENAIVGTDLGEGVAQEALLGGLFSAPPLRAGKAILGAGKALATGAGTAVAKTAAEKALTSPGLLTSIGQGIRGSARGVEAGSKVAGERITTAQAEKINRFLEETVKVKGTTIPKQLNSLDQFISRKNGELTGAIEQSNRALTNVERRSITNSIQKKISDGVIGGSAPTPAQQRILDDLTTRLKQAPDVKSVDSIRKLVDDRINFARNPQSPDLELEQMLKIFRTSLTDEVAGRVVGAKTLKSELAQALKAQELLLGRAGSNNSAIAAPLSVATIPVPNRLAQSGQNIIGGAVGTAGRVLDANAGRGIVPTVGRQTIGRGVLGTNMGNESGIPQPTGLEDALLSNQSQYLGSELYNPQQAYENAFATGDVNSPSVIGVDPGQFGYTPDNTASQNPYPQANLLFDIQRDPANADKYIAQYQQLQEIFGAPQQEALSQSNQSALASADNADNTLSQLESLFSTAGGGSGRIGGFVQNLAGQAGFDKNASVYNSLAQASVTQIAKALAGSGSGTVSDADARVIIAALPTLQDSPEEARAKFSALRQRLANAKQNTLVYGQGGTAPSSLEQALMQQGAL